MDIVLDRSSDMSHLLALHLIRINCSLVENGGDGKYVKKIKELRELFQLPLVVSK